MGLLYILRFSNGKQYVGVTTVRMSSRFAHHRRAALRGVDSIVYRAWRKYGEPQPLVIAIVNDAELYETEVRAIRVLNTFGSCGYNSTPGGDASPMKVAAIAKKVSDKARTPERIARNLEVHLGSKRSAETRAEMSKMRKGQGLGVPKSEDHKKNISAALRRAVRTYVATPEHRAKQSAAMLGRKFTPEHKAKISLAATGRKLSADTKKKLSVIAMARRANTP